MWRFLIERSLQVSCQETSYRDPIQRRCIERDVAEILPRGLLHRSCQENSSREIAQEIS